jgi:hypothetical protein
MSEWRDVPGYEGLYIISDDGTLISYARGLTHPTLDKDGYYHTALCKGGQMKYLRIHRLVAQAFIPNPENKPTVNHINEIKTDNRVENLEWATVAEQNAHGTRTARAALHHRGGAPKKPVLMYDKSNVFIRRYDAIRTAAVALNISKHNISLCCKGRAKSAGGYIWRYA